MFVGVCKDSATGAGSVVLDLLLKFGVLKYVDDRMWQLVHNAPSRCLYSYKDRKSNKNCTSFVSTLSNWPLPIKEYSLQAEILLEPYDNIMFLLGDWHSEMNMLLSICKVFWTDILSPMKMFLGWRRISKDVHACYFQWAIAFLSMPSLAAFVVTNSLRSATGISVSLQNRQIR